VDAALESAARLQSTEPGGCDHSPTFRKRTDLPDRNRWLRKVDQALHLIRDEVLEKIVLARCAAFRFDTPLCALSLMERLSAGALSCYRFCFQLDPNTAFLGATPERLFRRIGRQLESEVIAGTRRRGKSQAEDERLASELRNSVKEQLEHDIVRKSIRQRLHGCVEFLEVDAHASVLKLPRKQHLYSHVKGQLRAGIGDAQLLERLHPTPAVGGYPTDIALTEIERLEPFDRGWYAAPIGWIGSNDAEFAVAIRSGLLQGDRLSLYSGAGIVAGSTAEAEWDEIEHKIADFLEIIHSANGRE
jgi:menaquinone-specific isochorismate synthase